MSFRFVNLARRPLANTRPVLRVTVVLWTLGLLLALLNAVSYGRSLFGMEDNRQQLAALSEAMAEEREALAASEATLRQMNLRSQNQEAEFLNATIEERRFPWSGLFVRLSEVLPREVRLTRVSPQVRRELRSPRRRGRRDQPPVRRVALQMAGMARNDQALVDFLDALFASDAFDAPSLPNENREADGSLSFNLSVFFLPDDAVPSVAVASDSEEPPTPLPAGDLAEATIKIDALPEGVTDTAGEPRAEGPRGEPATTAGPVAAERPRATTRPGSPGSARPAAGTPSGDRRTRTAGRGQTPSATRGNEPSERPGVGSLPFGAPDEAPSPLAPAASTPGVVQ